MRLQMLAAIVCAALVTSIANAKTTITRLDNIRVCSEFDGVDEGAGIATCIADLPSTGGTADARGFEGDQNWGACPFEGVTKPVTLLLGAGHHFLLANCTVPSNVTLNFAVAGSILDTSDGKMLTINGAMDGPIGRRFFGFGPVVVSSTLVDRIYPQYFGAVSESDATNAIINAIASIPAAGGPVLAFTPGTWSVSCSDSSTTACIQIIDKHIDMACIGLSPGEAGHIEAGIPLIDAPCIISSKSNAPILKYTMATRTKGAINGRWSKVSGLYFDGAHSSLANQNCVEIDNRGIVMQDVVITRCGHHGLHLTDSDLSQFTNLTTQDNFGDGVNIGASITGSVNGNVFHNLKTLNNRGDGLNIVHGTQTTIFGADAEHNMGWGYHCQGGTPACYGTRAYGLWSECNGVVQFCNGTEDNTAGDLKIDDANALMNVFEFSRWGSRAFKVTGASNFSPIVITTQAKHGMATGDMVGCLDIGGNTAANGLWVVANLGPNIFELTGSTGNGIYTAGTGNCYGLPVDNGLGSSIKGVHDNLRFTGAGITESKSTVGEIRAARFSTFNSAEQFKPTAVTAGPAAGSGGSLGVSCSGCRDSAGTVQITTGNQPTVGVVAKVAFGNNYLNWPIVILTPAGPDALNSGMTRVYVPPPGQPDGPTQTGFSIFCPSTPLSANTTYTFTYMVVQVN